MVQQETTAHEIARIYFLLNGQDTIQKPLRNNFEAHDVLMYGMPISAVLHLISQLDPPTADNVQKALGMSVRTLQRRKVNGPRSVLSTEQSNWIWRFAELLSHAIEVFGSKSEAMAWLNLAAIGLNQRRPIDLLKSGPGVSCVREYLAQLEYGVYV